MSSNKFKRLFKDKIHQELRNYGIVEGDAFDVIVNIILTKIYDEFLFLEDPNRSSEFQVKSEDIVDMENFYNKINRLFKDASIKLLNENVADVERNEIINYPKKSEILLKIIPYFQEINLSKLSATDEDLMGDILLDFMHFAYRQSRGMFFTHPNICKFICKASGIKNAKSPKVIDPSCGSGAFLVESCRENVSAVIFGMDNNVVASRICKINMAIHRKLANVYAENALVSLEDLPFLGEDKVQKINGSTFQVVKEDCGFDFVFSNPPFSVEITKLEYKDIYRMLDLIPSKKGGTTTASECLFAERWFQLLRSGGRIGVVFPISLFDSPDYLGARLLFLCYFRIIAIVGLPEHVFSPYARQRTVLVFAERRDLDKSNEIFNHMFKHINRDVKQLIEPIKDEKIIFYDADSVGYVRQRRRGTVITNLVLENDLLEDIADIISEAFEGFLPRDDENLDVLTLQELAEKRKFVLVPNISKKAKHLQEIFILRDWEIAGVQKDRIDIEEDLLLCETGDIIAELGIIKPKKLSNLSSVNRQRLVKKIKSGKFGYLQEGDVIIAPVRIYQKKIAVVTKDATRFLFSGDFIVLRRKDGMNLLDSFALFYLLMQDENIDKLQMLSSTGKSGYPKIKNKEDILGVEFYKVDINRDRLEEMVNLYDAIYKQIVIF